ncbi:tetratricopeptide repeat protein 14 homolog isoform X2 [Schistocerca americana]|uniref:tetratricopeptide repeat protein 14 homolog isoform X2 n=1 Tax=Schistocerca americana TaxID=7009 RepID=UPI001F4FBFD1|nr:tetratricopeptide repeat protein 14 homolog isoform X2 [Schistocerca americana]XP_047107168.1 tetratricopeptide repeat protein 14 homolog isoform X2 [Schistocerca piceifrons]XP_049854543.1 tetratricopeptide repeat protein 14 homolog isoform X2 [Schistocerca gregaria]XP_049951477.1 tetratricopeptide repeat protein 14 homolog isoform X2 [Schistocerca serialis cubense]
MEPPLNPDLVVQSLNFHGQQLQKLWESERGEDDLSKVNVNSKEIDFEVYQQRQKQLSFQDRGKRLKLQQFIVKKATSLFELSLSEASETVKDKTQNDDVSDCYAVMPPYEAFIDLDKQSRLMHFLENLQRGDVVFCSIVSKSVSGLMLKVLCSDGEQQRYVSDINVKAFCPMSSMIPAADKKSVTRNYLVNDTVCCEVLEVMPDTEKLVVGMKGFALPPDSEYSCRLGLITSEDFPEMYKKTQDMKGESYQKVLEKTLGFYNPNNINYLANLLGLGSTNYSHMTGMRGRFPEQEYASELRQIQASKWAFRSVAEGIEHFKSGRHSEAFQCLNKALNIDPRNVEGLVARGALYANSGSFQKAIEDFETALKLNPNHQNARKYAGETLVALGRSYEDENKFDEALKAYQNCLSLIPFHEEAQNSIEYLKNKILNSSKLSDSEVTIPGLNSSKSAEVKETLKQLLKSNEEEEKKEKEKSKSKKKKERKSRKRRHRSSSSSSTSSSASSRSSSSSSSSSSDSSSASSRSGSHSRSRSPSRSRKSSKKHRKSSKKKEDKREKSLSPLSKRMALMDPNSEVEGLGGLLAQRVSHYNPPAVPFSFTPFQVVQDTSMQKSYEKDDYEQRVCRFLEQTKGDSEYEEKVRKFLEESARWKKERKAQEEKSKKKKKKEKKSRDKEKNKKKKREREEHEKKKKHRSKRSDKFDIKDFEEQMESKKFRDAIRKELTVKDETRKRKSIDDEEEFLYGSGSDKKDLRLLGLENLPDLEDLESKLSAYYAKVEKDTGLSKRSEEKGEKEKKRHSSSPGKNKHASPKVVFVHNEEAKVEETLRARDSPSPPANSKEKATPESATVMPSKWKIQIGSTNTRIKKKDKSQIEKEPWDEIEEKRFIFLKDNDKEGSEDEAEVRKKKQPEEKFSARKSRETAEKIVQEKPKKESSEEAREDSITKTQQFMDKFQSGFRINSSRSSEKKSDELPPLPPGMPPKTSFTISGRGKTTPVLANSSSQAKGPRTDSDTDSNASEKRKKKKPPQQQPQQQQPTPTSQQTPTAASSSAGPGRRLSSGESSRSRSRSRTKYSRASSSNSSRSRSRSYPKNRNRSKSASYDGRRSRSASYARYGSRSRSRSYYRSSASRSRSRSYRSRSRSYDRYSRSRSRSEDYRRRSRSESDDRRRRHDYHMNKFQGRYPRNRGTYYRPRFQSNYKNARGGSNFANRGNRNFHQKYGPGRGNRPFNNRGRGRGRPRFFHYKPSSGYRDYHSRRYEGRPRSRSSDGRRSYSREDDDPMKKVDAAKEKINKYIAEENKKDDAQAASSKSRDEPLSEGEAVDDDDYGLPPLPPGGPPSRESSYVDRKSYEGKWAEKDSEEKSSRNRGSEGPRLPPENSIEEMDKFLNKVKGQKKDDSKERSKSFGKSSSNW